MIWFIAFAGSLHSIFALCEILPWSNPILLKKATSKLSSQFTEDQQNLVATIVKNAGIYNAAFAIGFFWCFFRGQPAQEVAFILFVGATLAGAFGTATLKSIPTAVQALTGAIGCVYFWSKISW